HPTARCEEIAQGQRRRRHSWRQPGQGLCPAENGPAFAQDRWRAAHSPGQIAGLDRAAQCLTWRIAQHDTHSGRKARGKMQSHQDVSSTRKLPALEALQARPQWVCWHKEARKGKPTKVPYNPRSGTLARCDDPSTWATYAEACSAWHAYPDRY